MRILRAVLAIAALLVVGWICITAWDAITHGHPAYLVLLAVTLLAAVLVLVLSLVSDTVVGGWRRALEIVLSVLAVAWVGGLFWLTPFPAVEPALSAMESTSSVQVDETATSIVLLPEGDVRRTGLFFQPGARVDARAYAAVLRPVAEAGFPVVIAKQPLGIAFLATGAFESARDAAEDVERWVVGGHSLGGTVAAMDAQDHDADVEAPVSGLLLYASYPASDLSTLSSAVLSISGTLDGLTTPLDIESSRADLPPWTQFLPVDGAVHASFGDYGPQPGDGVATISHDDARSQISGASVDFIAGR